jgi:AsmA-like C-terminal region
MRFDSSFWRKCRVIFRRFRITVLSAALALICVVIWFNQAGLPDFLKKPLVEKLRERGIELEFTRLRVNFFHGLIADNVRIGRAETPGSPALSLKQVRMELNYRALVHRRLQIDGLGLSEGKLTWPVSETNGVSRALVLDRIQAELRFQTNDTWSLDDVHADFAGAKFSLSGDIAHASEVRSWEIFHARPSTNRPAGRQQLQKFYDTLDRIHFEGAPDLNLSVNGDARDLQSFTIRLTVNAPNADTPWGRVRRGWLNVQTTLSRASGTPHAFVRLEASKVNTPWGGADDIRFEADVSQSSNAPAADESWASWGNLQPYRFTWKAQCAQLQTDKLNADSVACVGFWSAPELAVTNLAARLGGGWLDAQAQLDVATRKFSFTNSSSFNLNAVSRLLTEKTQRWLEQFLWTQPPLLQAGGSLILPAWTNRQPDWRHEVQPTEQFTGKFSVAHGAFRKIGFDSVEGHFSYSNLVWQLPDLAVSQAGTRLELAGDENDATKDYHWRVHGALDPNTFRPLLVAANAERVFNQFTSSAPAQIDTDVWGRLYDYDRIGAHGRITLTNFSFRGQSAGLFQTAINYTNRVLELFGPSLRRGPEILTADRVAVDFNSWRIYFTNGFSTADPGAVTRAIGPKIGRVLEPYHFVRPPTVHVNGYAPLRDITNVDLSFEVDGGPFEWLKLKSPRVVGEVHWFGERLVLTNVTAAFYGGEATGFANFNFHPKEGADFQCAVDATNVNLHLLAADLSSPTNHLEGQLAAHAVVTGANTTRWRMLNGYARADLHEGLLWQVPIFGILSSPLNAISPGLGDSRATEASGVFAATNGVISSDKLEIHSTLTRLQYSGTVDLYQRVNARVNAGLLRDTWVIGPLLSTVLWPVSKVFEYQITGTLGNPKSEPVYVPKFLLLPLHPIRSLEEMFPGDTSTNAPPKEYNHLPLSSPAG